MPIALCLMFIAMPIFAALSFELNTFVLFMALFCVVAGLSAPDGVSANSSIKGRAKTDLRSRESRFNFRRQSPANRPNGSSSLGISRF